MPRSAVSLPSSSWPSWAIIVMSCPLTSSMIPVKFEWHYHDVLSFSYAVMLILLVSATWWSLYDAFLSASFVHATFQPHAISCEPCAGHTVGVRTFRNVGFILLLLIGIRGIESPQAGTCLFCGPTNRGAALNPLHFPHGATLTRTYCGSGTGGRNVVVGGVG